jgi:hypothetical protein
MLIREICPEDASAARAIWNEVVIAADAFPQIEPLSTDVEALEGAFEDIHIFYHSAM